MADLTAQDIATAVASAMSTVLADMREESQNQRFLGRLESEMTTVVDAVKRLDIKMERSADGALKLATQVNDLEHEVNSLKAQAERHNVKWTNYVTWFIGASVTVAMVLQAIGLLHT